MSKRIDSQLKIFTFEAIEWFFSNNMHHMDIFALHPGTHGCLEYEPFPLEDLSYIITIFLSTTIFNRTQRNSLHSSNWKISSFDLNLYRYSSKKKKMRVVESFGDVQDNGFSWVNFYIWSYWLFFINNLKNMVFSLYPETRGFLEYDSFPLKDIPYFITVHFLSRLQFSIELAH